MRKGFTLIELMIYISAAFILLSGISLLTPKKSELDLTMVVNELKDDIRYVQSLSMKESRKYKIWTSDKKYYSYAYDQGNDTYLTVKTVRLPDGIAFSGAFDIYFTKRGTVTKGVTLFLVRENMPAELVTLTINVSAGRVEIT